MKEAAVTLRDSGSISLLVRRNSYSNTKELDAFLWTYGGDLFADFLGPKTFCLSVLQEFLAATLGVYVGKLFFVSPTPLYSLDEIQLEQFGQFSTMFDPSYEKVKETVPLVADPATFYAEATELLNNYKDTDWLLHVASELTESFIRDVMVPMMMAYQLWRTNKKRDAYDTIKLIKADDWRLVSKNWLANNERMNDAKEDTE